MREHESDTVPYFNGLPYESLDEYRWDVENYVHGTKIDERKLCGPRLLRKLGGIPGALARRKLKPEETSREEGWKLIFAFLEAQGYKKDTIDRKLLAQKRYEAISRKPHQSLMDFRRTWPLQTLSRMALPLTMTAGPTTCY